jgi:hypothetical protein
MHVHKLQEKLRERERESAAAAIAAAEADATARVEKVKGEVIWSCIRALAVALVFSPTFIFAHHCTYDTYISRCYTMHTLEYKSVVPYL